MNDRERPLSTVRLPAATHKYDVWRAPRRPTHGNGLVMRRSWIRFVQAARQTADAMAPAARRDSTECSVLAGTYEAVLVGVDHGLYAVAAAEFGKHAGDVRLDSALADMKANGEFLVGQACGNQAKHFPFSFGE